VGKMLAATLAVAITWAGLAPCASLALAPFPAGVAPSAEGGQCLPGTALAADRTEPSRVVQRIHAHVAGNMPGLPTGARTRVARAIIGEAKAARIDPLLVLALIHVESSFDPQAASSAGAVGLMQLMDATMRAEVVRSNLPSADPRDPVANVRAGVRYLRRLIDAFGGLDLALMAYNAGPNRIVGLRRHGGIPKRFRLYPRKVKAELKHLRWVLNCCTDRAGAPGPPPRV